MQAFANCWFFQLNLPIWASPGLLFTKTSGFQTHTKTKKILCKNGGDSAEEDYGGQGHTLCTVHQALEPLQFSWFRAAVRQ